MKMKDKKLAEKVLREHITKTLEQPKKSDYELAIKSIEAGRKAEQERHREEILKAIKAWELIKKKKTHPLQPIAEKLLTILHNWEFHTREKGGIGTSHSVSSGSDIEIEKLIKNSEVKG